MAHSYRNAGVWATISKMQLECEGKQRNRKIYGYVRWLDQMKAEENRQAVLMASKSSLQVHRGYWQIP
jgi:hypothetical protein